MNLQLLNNNLIYNNKKMMKSIILKFYNDYFKIFHKSINLFYRISFDLSINYNIIKIWILNSNALIFETSLRDAKNSFISAISHEISDFLWNQYKQFISNNNNNFKIFLCFTYTSPNNFLITEIKYHSIIYSIMIQ